MHIFESADSKELDSILQNYQLDNYYHGPSIG